MNEPARRRGTRLTRTEFFALLDRLADGWSSGDAEAVAAEFSETVHYGDPTRYRFGRRADLLPFFEPPPNGQFRGLAPAGVR